MKKTKIPAENRRTLNYFIKKGYDLKHMTYIELGIFLQDQGVQHGWVSLAEAHDWLGGYMNEGRDKEIIARLQENWYKLTLQK